MLKFVLGSLEKNFRDLVVAFLLGLTGEKGVARTCLALTGESGEKIFFGLCSV